MGFLPLDGRKEPANTKPGLQGQEGAIAEG